MMFDSTEHIIKTRPQKGECSAAATSQLLQASENICN